MNLFRPPNQMFDLDVVMNAVKQDERARSISGSDDNRPGTPAIQSGEHNPGDDAGRGRDASGCKGGLHDHGGRSENVGNF